MLPATKLLRIRMTHYVILLLATFAYRIMVLRLQQTALKAKTWLP